MNYVGERGLLSLAFDPQFTSNGNVFVYFTDPTGDIAIERYTFPVTRAQPPSGSESLPDSQITSRCVEPRERPAEILSS